MEKLKFKRIKLLSERENLSAINGLHKCPLTKIDYYGACTLLTCPANVSSSRSNTSGCFLEQGKPSLIDVARWTKISVSNVKRQYIKGMKKIDKFINFYNFIINNRTVNNTAKHCPICGIKNTHGLKCLNKLRCQDRATAYNKAKKRFPINVQPLNVTPAEFLDVCQHEEMSKFIPKKVRKFIKSLIERK